MDANSRQTLLARVAVIPIVETLRISIDEFSEGTCMATVPRQRAYDGIYESLHGGILMTIADSIACFAIMTHLGPDAILTTTDMNIRFLAPCLTDVSARATVIKIGKTLCPVAVDLYDESATKVAVAQVTYMRLSAMPSRPAT